jgi:uncharacterized membrane protein YphA (DoxX/SURF4 family)
MRSVVVNLRIKPSHVPLRLVTGAFILHSGREKWKPDEARAAGVHGMAAGAFPVLKDIPPPRFLRLLALGEIAVGAALLVPVVPSLLAGATLTAFSGSLVAMYVRTPALRKPGSIWPSPAGVGVSKDIWMLGIGLALVADGIATKRPRK